MVAKVIRNTNETKIQVQFSSGGGGNADVATGIPFLDHMLDQLARHGDFNLKITCDGDTEIDDHHSVEDVGITLGQAIAKWVGNKSGINRFGHAYTPLDEALSRVVIDFSGRPLLVMNVPFKRARIGNFDVDLLSEFFRGLANHASMTIHIDNLRGENAHHQAESVFKAFAKALQMALVKTSNSSVPSTKGCL